MDVLSQPYAWAANVPHYLTPSASAIELQRNHLRIECGLPPEFW
jgi:hypothetical protein